MATEEVAMTYALAAVERAMKVYEVLVQGPEGAAAVDPCRPTR